MLDLMMELAEPLLDFKPELIPSSNVEEEKKESMISTGLKKSSQMVL